MLGPTMALVLLTHNIEMCLAMLGGQREYCANARITLTILP